jgi:hypothetical protein
VGGYVAARSSLAEKLECNNLNFKAIVTSISLVVEVNTGSEDMTYLNYAFSNLDHHENETRRRVDHAIKLLTWMNLQTRVNTINCTLIGDIRFEKFKFDVSHMSYQKPRLRPRLTAFLTQSLSRGPCEAVTTAHVGSAFGGSASAGLRL